MKGLLIVIAGIDGSGKTTISEKITQLISKKNGINATCEKFIYDNKYDKESLRETVKYVSLKRKECTNAEFEHIRSCYFLKKRILDIYKRVAQGEIIILDRFVETIIGHQDIFGFDKNIAMDICNFNVYKAECYFMLKVEPELAYKRIVNRIDDFQYHEKMENLRKLDCIYTRYALEHKGKIIDGTCSLEAVLAEIYREIESYICEKK